MATSGRRSRHVYPAAVAAEHNTTGLVCWCVPRYFSPCDECTDGCWKCSGKSQHAGLIELTVDDATERYTAGEGILIVHNR